VAAARWFRATAAVHSANNHQRTASTSGAGFSEGSSAPSSIDFGFQQVPLAQKQALVHDVFARVAQSYDVMNDAMSMGMHRVWKADLVGQIRPAANVKHLDVAGGTGDIAFRVLMAAHREAQPPAYRVTGNKQQQHQQQPQSTGNAEQDAAAAAAAYDAAAQVIVCDINDNMLRVGIDRARAQYGYEPGALIKPAEQGADGTPADAASSGTAAPVSPARPVEHLSASRIFACHGPLAFVSGNAEALPFESDSFDSYTIVFGLRNVTHRDRALKEALRVLRPGGRFLCMEFSQVQVPLFDQVYSQYSQWIIPTMGQLIAGDRASYQYLVESIAKMPDQERLANLVREAGFVGVDYRNLTGGIVAIHQGFKPLQQQQ
jgi:2-methoxy-6-polyprenyl-1,4-benzoquinol methylase